MILKKEQEKPRIGVFVCSCGKNIGGVVDVKKVTEAIRRGMYWATGPNVQGFEKSLAKYVGVNYAVTFNSGTSALHAIMLALNIGPGHEVIVPSFTCAPPVSSAILVGAIPVFADMLTKSHIKRPRTFRFKVRISNDVKIHDTQF